MTGRGRCRGRRRKSMAGGSGAAGGKKIDANLNNPNLKPEFTENPSSSPRITKLPPASGVDFLDLYSQARKALSYTSPFDSEESQAGQAVVSSVSTLPSGVSHLLGRHSDGRKRQKKFDSSWNKKSSPPAKVRGSSIWVETEEYFRDLDVGDIDRLDKISNDGFSSNEKCFLIPFLNNDDGLSGRSTTVNSILTSACMNGYLNLRNSVEFNSFGKLEYDRTMAQEGKGPHVVDVHGLENGAKEPETKGENNGEKRLGIGKDCRSFSGVEWILGSRRKIYLVSDRPSKKRKLVGRDAGLEKLLVARPVEGSESICDYCSYGDMGDPLNFLIKCSSCGMMVHQRCYGVQEDVDSSWLCSWCKWKNLVDLRTETPCLLCPRQGGALKPVRKSCFGSETEGSKVEFAHLFCCQWLPEVYLENTRTMEPIMNMDKLKDTRRKLICYLCKVKYGACVRCSNGSCRTAFHPICAREAQHRMEIWGKLGSDEVELRAFCSRHSKVQCDSGSQCTVEISSPANLDHSKQSHVVFDGDKLLDSSRNSESHQLVELGKVSAKDVASEIGVTPDSLNTILTDNHMVPESQYKLLRWLKNHVHIGNLQNALKLKLRSLLTAKSVADADATECVAAASVDEPTVSAVPIKSVPLPRTKSNLRTRKSDKSCSSKDNNMDKIPVDDVGLCSILGEDSNGPSGHILADTTPKMLIDPQPLQDHLANCSIRLKDELTAQVPFLSEDGLVGGIKQAQQMIMCSFVLTNGDVHHASYIHPLIYSKLMQTNIESLEKSASYQPAVLGDMEASQEEVFSRSDLCCNNNLQAASGDWTSECDGVNVNQLLKAKNLSMLKQSPADEVEGALIYYQQRLLHSAAARKLISDDLIAKVVRRLPKEIDAAGKQKWDTVLVGQYIHELQEAKKQGRREHRHKEAQAVLAAATAAAAASSRMSSFRKDILEESSQQDLLKKNISDARLGSCSKLNPQLKLSIPRAAAARSSFDVNSDAVQLASAFAKDHPRTCDICRHSDTVLNPILLCSSCKVAVHVDCYCSVKSTTIPWHCELCEELFSSPGSEALATGSCGKPYLVAECGLCGGTAGAFRKSVNGQWIHAFCAEWVLESSYRKGQVNPIDGMDTVGKGVHTCIVCHHKQGVCLKCSYGHCRTTFHPTCARSAGFFMTLRTNAGKLRHKAYCEKHSTEQRAKAGIQRLGIEELKGLKQVRVGLERLRLLCERIIKREKLKRELVLCSHDILATSRDSVLSALARHPFYQPEVCSESAETCVQGDSAVAGKRRVKLHMSMHNVQNIDDSSTYQNLYMLKPLERASFSGQEIPQGLSDDVEKQSAYRNHNETFGKELIMTSEEASLKNQRLPKGFVYVPIRYISKGKEIVPDSCSQEPADCNG